MTATLRTAIKIRAPVKASQLIRNALVMWIAMWDCIVSSLFVCRRLMWGRIVERWIIVRIMRFVRN